MATKTDTKTKTASAAPAKGAKPGAKNSKAALGSEGVLKGTQTGVVESAKRSTSRTVVVSYQSKHPKYGKYIGNRTVLQVHDQDNISQTGDVVEVTPCRPVSRTKSWRLVKVVEARAKQAAALASAKEIV
ncbi:MAG: 30S ribosomal protein S17 [Planctomycetota bacterium]